MMDITWPPIIAICLIACLVCYMIYLAFNAELQAAESRADKLSTDVDTLKAASCLQRDKADELDKERAQLADELSEAKHREQQQLQQVEAANQRIEKLSDMLREATRGLESEQCKRAKVEAEYDAYRTQVNQAIDRLRGQTA